MDTVNAVVNWILPLNCHWFWLFVIASAVVAIIAWVWTCANYSTIEGVERTTVYHPFKTFLRGFVAFWLSLVCIAFIVWIIYANNCDPVIASEERLEIKPVTYPNGRVVQMFSCEGTNYNANQMFSSAPPEGSYVRRLIYKRVYAGVYFPPSGNASKLNDGFFLVTPDKNERKADSVVPDKQ